MAATPSFAARTAIALGIENRDASNDLVIRDAGLEQIPIYNAFNPVQARGATTALNRAKTGLGSDGFAIGEMSYAVSGEVYVFGSGIANLPPAYFQIVRACGFKEIRLASIDAPAASPVSAESASGGYMKMVAGGYGYAYTVLYKANGTDEATTLAEAAFESKLSAKFVDASPDTSDTGDDTEANWLGSAALSGLPTDGIKRIYRTAAGGGSATLDPANYQYVGSVADGSTTFTDTLADKNRGQRGVFPGVEAVGSFAPTEAAGGSLDLLGTYRYRFSVLYDKDGNLITVGSDETADQAADRAAYEALLPVADAVSETLTSSNRSCDVSFTGVAAGVRRLYRQDNGVATSAPYYFVANVAHNASTYNDGLADATLLTRHQLYDTQVSGVSRPDKGIYVPVSEYLDFDAMTFQCYLDSRKYPVKSARGTMDFEGTVGGNFLGRFTLEGIYGTSTKVANPTLASNPGAPPQICAIELQITPESAPTTDRTLRVSRFGLSFGRQPAPRRDANASCDNTGLVEYMISNPADPRLTATFEVPKEIGTGDDTDWIDDFKTSEFYAFRFHIGTDAREKVYFTNWAPWMERRFLAQLAEPPQFESDGENGIRMFAANWALTERTGIDASWISLRHEV